MTCGRFPSPVGRVGIEPIFNRTTADMFDGSLWVLWVGFDGQGLRPTPGSINEQ